MIVFNIFSQDSLSDLNIIWSYINYYQLQGNRKIIKCGLLWPALCLNFTDQRGIRSIIYCSRTPLTYMLHCIWLRSHFVHFSTIDVLIISLTDISEGIARVYYKHCFLWDIKCLYHSRSILLWLVLCINLHLPQVYSYFQVLTNVFYTFCWLKSTC